MPPAEKPSIVELRCKHHLTNFIKLGEIGYKIRYQHNRVVDKCIELFKNPQSELYYNTVKMVNNSNSILSKILVDKHVGDDFHIVKYQVCNFENESKQKILFKSNIETSLIVLPKALMPKQCTDFWTELKYVDIDSIKISWDDNVKNLKNRRVF